MNELKVFHQLGWRSVWNLSVYNDDKIGDGMIVGPMSMTTSDFSKLNKDIRTRSFFDPQFYEPRNQNKKIKKFDFFPNQIMDEYNTVDFQSYCLESAEKCVEYQIANDYKYIVIPSIYHRELPSDFFDCWYGLFIKPYIELIKEKRSDKKILLTVLVKDIQLNDDKLRNELLNFITGIKEIYGVYLISDHREGTKRYKNIEYLFNMMKFLTYLKSNGLYVHLGFVDVEGLLFSLAGIDSLSIGVYENRRRFAIDNFKGESRPGGGAPNVRLYSNTLLQWIDSNYFGALKELDFISELFESNKHLNFNIKKEQNWHFKQPDSYKHYMTSVYNQYKNLSKDFTSRKAYLIDIINRAMEYNNRINDNGIIFDRDCDDKHLAPWLTVINRYNDFLEGME